MLKRIRYFFWKRFAKKSIAKGKTATCVACDDPIIPGDFVGICYTNDDPTAKLIHAGYHFSVSQIDAFCETGAIGCAIWSGEECVSLGESLASRAMKTGNAQVR